MSSIMNFPKPYSSPTIPTYKNLNLRLKQSPVELKEKLRKDYKTKVQSCRDMLINRFRGNDARPNIHDTVREVYKNIYDFTDHELNDDEEMKILEEIKNELIQEELKWWSEEYDKSQHVDLDWSVLHQEENVICPVCQKTNFDLVSGNLFCPNCKVKIKMDKSLKETKQNILDAVEKHSNSCTNDPQFSVITETNDTHIYLICDSCSEMQLVI